jgi:hypothetical protein
MPADTAMAGRSLAMAGRSKFETMTEFSKFKGPKQDDFVKSHHIDGKVKSSYARRATGSLP